MTKIVRSKKNQQIYLAEVTDIGLKILGGPYKSKEHAEKARTRRARNEAMESLGLTKVKGNLGGVCWE